jgi:hypothetical protein
LSEGSTRLLPDIVLGFVTSYVVQRRRRRDRDVILGKLTGRRRRPAGVTLTSHMGNSLGAAAAAYAKRERAPKISRQTASANTGEFVQPAAAEGSCFTSTSELSPLLAHPSTPASSLRSSSSSSLLPVDDCCRFGSDLPLKPCTSTMTRRRRKATLRYASAAPVTVTVTDEEATRRMTVSQEAIDDDEAVSKGLLPRSFDGGQESKDKASLPLLRPQRSKRHRRHRLRTALWPSGAVSPKRPAASTTLLRPRPTRSSLLGVPAPVSRPSGKGAVSSTRGCTLQPRERHTRTANRYTRSSSGASTTSARTLRLFGP